MTSWKQHVKSDFSAQATEWAGYYVDPEPPLSRQHLVSRQQFALGMVETAIPLSSRILDAGCGPGVMVGKLMERGHSVWGIDVAEPMIRKAREFCRSDRFGVGDVEHLPFPDNTFDVVVSLGVIEYLESDEGALREIWRVLRPGGRAVIAISNGRSPLLRLDRVLRRWVALLRPAHRLLTGRFRGAPAPSPETPGGVAQRSRYRRFYRSTWLRLLRGCNFEPEEWICHGWGWLSSPLGLVAQRLSVKHTVFGRLIERLFSRALLAQASDRFVRSRALNWLAAEHVFRVRAIKRLGSGGCQCDMAGAT